MAITRTSQVDDDGSGTTGTIWNNAWKTELYNQIDAADGVWVDVPTVAGDFVTVGPSGVWTVTSVLVNAVHRSGQLVVWDLAVNASTIAVASTGLAVKLPNGWGLLKQGFGTFTYVSVGVTGVGYADWNGTFLSLYRDALGSVPFAAGAVTIHGTFPMAVA